MLGVPSVVPGLRIWRCHSCGLGRSCGLDSVLGPGTFIRHGCDQKRKKKNQKPSCLTFWFYVRIKNSDEDNGSGLIEMSAKIFMWLMDRVAYWLASCSKSSQPCVSSSGGALPLWRSRTVFREDRQQNLLAQCLNLWCSRKVVLTQRYQDFKEYIRSHGFP